MTEEVQRSTLTVFPSVDEAIPLWERPAGQKGRLTKVQLAAKEANAKAREAYQLLYAANDIFLQQVVAYERDAQEQDVKDARLSAELSRLMGDNARLTNQHREAKRRSKLALILAGQLAYLMDDELELLTDGAPDSFGLRSVSFRNKWGEFTLLVNGENLSLEIQPADKTRQRRTVPLDDRGLPPDSTLILAGHLGLPKGGRPFKRVAPVLRVQPTPADVLCGGVNAGLTRQLGYAAVIASLNRGSHYGL